MAPAQELPTKVPLELTQVSPTLAVVAGIFALVVGIFGIYLLVHIFVHRSRTSAKFPLKVLVLPSPVAQASSPRWNLFKRFSLPSIPRCSALLKAISLRVSRTRDHPPAQTIAEHLDMDSTCRGVVIGDAKETAGEVERKPSVSLAESLSLRYLEVLEKAAAPKGCLDATNGAPEKADDPCQPPPAPKPVVIEIVASIPQITVSLPSSDHISRPRVKSGELDTTHLSPSYSPPPVYSALPPADRSVIDAATRAHRTRSQSRKTARLTPSAPTPRHVLRPRPQFGLFAAPIMVAPGKPSPREGWL